MIDYRTLASVASRGNRWRKGFESAWQFLRSRTIRKRSVRHHWPPHDPVQSIRKVMLLHKSVTLLGPTHRQSGAGISAPGRARPNAINCRFPSAVVNLAALPSCAGWFVSCSAVADPGRIHLSHERHSLHTANGVPWRHQSDYTV